jgi:hypothetical protein
MKPTNLTVKVLEGGGANASQILADTCVDCSNAGGEWEAVGVGADSLRSSTIAFVSEFL